MKREASPVASLRSPVPRGVQGYLDSVAQPPSAEKVALEKAEAQVYLSQNVFQVVLQKSIPTQIRLLILYISNSKGYVDGFMGGVDFCKTTLETLCVR